MKKENCNEKKFEEIKEKMKEVKEEKKECEKERDMLMKELEEYKKKSEDYYDQLLRLKAEFENYRKRVEKEKNDMIKFGKYDLMQSILPLYEMMNMAKKHLETSNSYEDIKVGLGMIFNEFEKIFKANGLTEIDILNKKYDPMLCEIVATVDGEEDGKVVEIIQPGYIIDGRLLKPAKVKIIKKVDFNSNATSEPGSKDFSDSSNAGSESSEN